MIPAHRYFISVGRVALLLLATASLDACISATKIVKNDKATIKEYHDVYFLRSKEDPRGVNAKAIKQFESIRFKVTLVDSDKPPEGAHGTGFLISQEGHLLTCAHVIGDAKEATIWIAAKRYEADVLSTDTEKDIAMLKLRTTNG